MNKTNPEHLKAEAYTSIEQHRNQLYTLSNLIHSHPETAMNEYNAVAWLTQELQKHGFTIERAYCDLPTAFRASYGSGQPVIAFIAEYDALPDIGHACGHNLIATSAVAAAIGSIKAVDNIGGSIQVIGTPAEEVHGGKITMAERGAFAGIDAAMMTHPATYNSATVTALACISLDIEFFGKGSHAAAHPEHGINALDAMITSFGSINSMKKHLNSDMCIHGIITDGGQVANIIPSHSAGRFLVRARNIASMDMLRAQVLDCFKGGSIATGARLQYKWNEHEFYAPMHNNSTMAQLYIQNMAQLGIQVPFSVPNQSFGSTDMGNVSQITPSIHTLVAIAPPSESEHTHAFARFAANEHALTQSLLAATALAMTAIDLMLFPEILSNVKQEFITQN